MAEINIRLIPALLLSVVALIEPKPAKQLARQVSWLASSRHDHQ